MKLKLDENLGEHGADLLRQARHDERTVADQGMQGAPDHTLIDACRREGRGLVTLDLGFGNPLLFKPSLYRGIAVLRLPHRPSPEDLHDAVRTLIGGLERESLDGKLWVVQHGRLRVYQEEYDE